MTFDKGYYCVSVFEYYSHQQGNNTMAYRTEIRAGPVCAKSNRLPRRLVGEARAGEAKSIGQAFAAPQNVTKSARVYKKASSDFNSAHTVRLASKNPTFPISLL